MGVILCEFESRPPHQEISKMLVSFFVYHAPLALAAKMLFGGQDVELYSDGNEKIPDVCERSIYPCFCIAIHIRDFSCLPENLPDYLIRIKPVPDQSLQPAARYPSA